MSLTETARPSRPWKMALPLGLLVLAALGWSGAWFYASYRAQHEIEAWIAREATQGRTWSCGERTFGGFPFRFELMCTEPTVTFAGTDGWKASAQRAHAVAQVWDPGHIIAEFQGPGVITQAATGRQLQGAWSLLQVSGVGSSGRVERMSLAVDNYALTEGGTALFAARHGEIHVRHHPGDDNPTLDLAAGVLGATGTRGTGIGKAPVDAELDATITDVPQFRSMPMEDRLRGWQAAGGRAKLLLAKATAGAAVLTASGDVGLDADGRPDGALTVNVAGAEALLKGLAASDLMPPVLAGVGSIVGMAGTPTEVDGRKASAFNVRFRDGRVFLGPLPLGRIAPLW
jgi:hypothetical protein